MHTPKSVLIVIDKYTIKLTYSEIKKKGVRKHLQLREWSLVVHIRSCCIHSFASGDQYQKKFLNEQENLNSGWPHRRYSNRYSLPRQNYDLNCN